MTSFDDLISDSNQKLTELKTLVDSLILRGNMATQEEIKNAIIQALEESASRFLSGQSGNVVDSVEIGTDGTITLKPSGSAPDDPTTSADEEARSGAVISIRKGFNLVWADLNSYFTANHPVTTAQFRIKSKYKVADEGAMDAAIALYYQNRDSNVAQVTSFANTLDSRLYCKGETKQVINAWIFDTVPAAAQEQAIALVKSISDSQIDEWYLMGKKVPSTDYITYSCVPVDSEEFILDLAYLTTGSYKVGTSIHKLNHRILVEVSGKVNHVSDGSYQDFFWRVQNNGNKSFAGTSTTFGTIQFNAPFGNPSQTKVPFKASGIYQFTMDTTSAQALNFRRVISGDYAGSGSYKIKFIDKGEILE